VPVLDLLALFPIGHELRAGEIFLTHQCSKSLVAGEVVHKIPSVKVRHAIPFAIVFEQGATIEGDPLLWLPLPTCPPTIGGRKASPKAYEATIGPLSYVNAHGTPLLVGQTTGAVPDPASGARRLASARRQRLSELRDGARAGGSQVPLFVGVPTVRIGKKFDVLGVVERVYSDMAKYFAASLAEG
jgi:hypothetical protein